MFSILVPLAAVFASGLPTEFFTIGPDDGPAAIAAVLESAADGDVIYMEGGEYPALVIEGKGLTLAPEPGGGAVFLRADPETGVSLTVRSVPASSTFNAVALNFSSTFPSATRFAVVVEDCSGTVVLESPRLYNAGDPFLGVEPLNSLLTAVNSGLVVVETAIVIGAFIGGSMDEPVIQVVDTDLVVNRSFLIGSGIDSAFQTPVPHIGQTVLSAYNSRVTLSDSVLRAGDGGNSPIPLGQLFSGCSGRGAELFGGSVIRCFGATTLSGGDWVATTPASEPGNECFAQPAVRLSSSSRFEYLASTVLTPGTPGPFPPPPVIETLSGSEAVFLDGELTLSEIDAVDALGPALAYRLDLFGAVGNLEFILFQAFSPAGLEELPEVSGLVGVDPDAAILRGPVLLEEPPAGSPGSPNGTFSFQLPPNSVLVGRSLWAQSAHFDSESGELRTSILARQVVLP